MTCPYTISGIKDGQYTVTIDLQEWMCPEQILGFQKNIQEIAHDDPYFKAICGMYGSILRYRSETLFPEKDNPEKQKILIILGNPATHSVAKGIFFYSMRKGKNGGEKTHNFWRKLEKAKLINEIQCETLEQEASERKQLIIEGQISPDYLLGLTTFYSFPTPVKGTFKDVAGIKKLFHPILKEIQRMECYRLHRYVSDYPFVKNALYIFTEKTTYQYVTRHCFLNTIKRWPARGPGSSGGNLERILLDP